MQQRILDSLGIPDAKVFVRDVDRPNIAMLRWECQPEQRVAEIASMLRMPQLHGQRAMVFVPSVRVGEDLVWQLAELGLEVPLFHSKLGSSWERSELLQRFLGASRPPVNHIICTNAFGMGLDVPNVRLVVHSQQSASVEDMLQEVGRAGRDRKPSVSVIFHDGRGRKDSSRLKFMAEKMVGGAALDEHAENIMLKLRYHEIDQVAEMLRASGCFRASIRSYFGQGDDQNAGRTLSERIVEWVSGRGPQVVDKNSVSLRHSSRKLPLKLSSDIVPVDLPVLRPAQDGRAGELGAVFEDDDLRQAAPGVDGIKQLIW